MMKFCPIGQLRPATWKGKGEREREGKNGQTKEAKEEREKTKSENEAAAKIGIVPAVMTIIGQKMISSQTYIS